MKRILVASILSVIICSCNTKQEKVADQPAVISPAPAKIESLLLNGNSPDLSKYKGKNVFINYWATWCGPCVSEMPSLQRMVQKLKNEKIVFLFASDETTEVIAGFKNSNNYDMEFVKIADFAQLGIPAIPSTFIYNTSGELVFTETGSREWDSDESITMINKIIKQ